MLSQSYGWSKSIDTLMSSTLYLGNLVALLETFGVMTAELLAFNKTFGASHDLRGKNGS